MLDVLECVHGVIPVRVSLDPHQKSSADISTGFLELKVNDECYYESYPSYLWCRRKVFMAIDSEYLSESLCHKTGFVFVKVAIG